MVWMYWVYGIVEAVVLFTFFCILFTESFDDAKTSLMCFAGTILWPVSAIVAIVYGTLLGLYRIQLMFQSACFEMAKEYRKETKELTKI